MFSLMSVNTLILDEPTNHLDMQAIQSLEEALSTYKGTVVLVSHDRYFLEKAKLDSVYVIDEGKFSRIPDYQQYITKAEEKAQKLIRLVK